jgi:hypothetical protein
MTIHTADLVDQWPVYSFLVKCFVHHIFMALATQLSGFLFGLYGSGFLVALSTPSLDNCSVGHIKDNTPIVRSVGVMAGSAVGIFYRVIHVLPFE